MKILLEQNSTEQEISEQVLIKINGNMFTVSEGESSSLKIRKITTHSHGPLKIEPITNDLIEIS